MLLLSKAVAYRVSFSFVAKFAFGKCVWLMFRWRVWWSCNRFCNIHLPSGESLRHNTHSIHISIHIDRSLTVGTLTLHAAHNSPSLPPWLLYITPRSNDIHTCVHVMPRVSAARINHTTNGTKRNDKNNTDPKRPKRAPIRGQGGT